VDFGPKQSGWLINQLGINQFIIEVSALVSVLALAFMQRALYLDYGIVDLNRLLTMQSTHQAAGKDPEVEQ
jgi:hypothetical protein